AAEKSGRERGRRSRVAYAHLAEANKVRRQRYSIVTGRDRSEEFSFGHGGRLREIAGGPFERQGNDTQICAGAAGKLVDGRAPGREIRDHLGRDLGGISGHSTRGHTVVCCKNQYFNAIETRWAAALPGSEPGHELFQPAEASWGFGKFALAARNG